VAQWYGRWSCDWRSRVQSKLLHCRLWPWASQSPIFASVAKQY